MSKNEQHKDTNDFAEAKNAIKDARQNAKENPADEQKVRDFRKKHSYPPSPVRKKKTPSKRKPTKAEAERARAGKTEESCRLRQATRRSSFYKGVFLEGYKNLSALGLEETAISRLFGVKDEYVSQCIGTDEELEKSYQEAMNKLHSMLSQWILVKALGYNYEEEKITYCKQGATRKKSGKDRRMIATYNPQKKVHNSKWLEYRKEIMKKHQPGSDQLLIFYMTNRFPDKWKVSRELLTGKAEGYDSKPGERNRKAIGSLGRDVLEQNTNGPEAEHPVQDRPARVSVGSEQDGEK